VQRAHSLALGTKVLYQVAQNLNYHKMSRGIPAPRLGGDREIMMWVIPAAAKGCRCRRSWNSGKEKNLPPPPPPSYKQGIVIRWIEEDNKGMEVMGVRWWLIDNRPRKVRPP